MKHKFSKRMVAILLTLAMVLTLMPMTFAEPAAEEYVLASELKAGDKVVIYHPDSGMALSNADLSETQPKYRAGVAVTPEDGKLTNPDAALIWTVAEVEGGFTLADADGKLLGVDNRNLYLNAQNTVWKLHTGATEGTVYISSVGAPVGSQSGDPQAIEWYSRYSEFTTYYLSSSADFVLQLFVLNEGGEEPPAEDLSGKTVILHTNDTHGALLGFAQVAKVKADYEAMGANVILVDAGDYSQGASYVSLSKGETAVTVMNAAGYDYAILGNHEFDYGWPQLKANLEKAEFQPIVADVIDEATGKSVYDGHVIKEVGGVKIGFFGMETPEASTKANPALLQGLVFPQAEEMYAIAQAEIDALKSEGADVIIALTHLGVDDESEPNRSIDLYANISGVDFIIDGHSHTVMTEGPSGEPIQSTGTKASDEALMNVGLIQIDNATKKIEKNELIPLGEGAPVDAAVAAIAQEIMDAVNAEYNVVFATSEVELNGDRAPGNRNMETNLGDLITDSMLWAVQKTGGLTVDENHVVAITNGGGIRAWIHAGDVTKKDVNTVLPFGNTVAVVYVTGAELLEALEASTYCTPTAVGGFPQVSGMKFNIDTSKDFVAGNQYPGSTYYGPAGITRVSVDEVNGQPFNPEDTYAVITNNFCAAGGDTYYAFAAATNQFDTGLPLDEVLMDYISTGLNGVITASRYADPQGRITFEERAGAMEGKTVILHTNDTHGALLGFAQVAKVKALYEAQGAEVILVDAGDFSQGTTYVSTNKGEAAVTVMNAAGYDVVTLGNHEFDFGYAQLMENLDKAEFLPLCTDVFLKETGETILSSGAILEAGGVKIGFFGMETPETQTKVHPGLITEIEFGTNENGLFLDSAQSCIAALKEAGADLIIGLTHLGVDDESEPYRSIDFYAQVKDDVDFLIDGHSHTVMTEGPNGEPIQSTGTKASKTALMNVGLIQIDNATKKIEKNELIPLGEDAPVDADVAAVAQAIMDAVDAEYGAVFAQSMVELNGDRAPGNRNMETNLGDLITDALRWSVMKDMDAETLGVPEENVIAITNGGGIRAWIHKGDVTKNDINTVLPFGNTVAVVYVTGAELLEALEASTYCTPTAVGGFPQVSGIQFNIATNLAFDEGDLYPGSTYHAPNSIKRVSIDNINGKPFDPEATYAVITNNFCAAGGDTYYVFKNASAQFDTGIPMDEALIGFIQEPNFLNGTISDFYAEPQGRITQEDGEFLFDDVTDPEQYYYEPVYWAYNHEITDGVSDTEFGPNQTCKREQVVTFLWRAYGKQTPASTENPFNDVAAGTWYTDPVLWAVGEKITDGVADGVFGVGQDCTRAQVVTFLWRAAGEPEPKSMEHPFDDVVAGSWYEKAVVWAVEQGITDGVEDNLFAPDATCIRAQIVTFLYRALKEPEPVNAEFEFLVTSDLHGQIFATDYTAAYSQSGTYKRGLTRVSSYIKEQKEVFGENLYVVDMGDTFQGAPLTYYYAFNKPDVKDPAILAFRSIGYDMWIVGNHEFNYGLEILNRQMAYAVSPAEENEKQLTICLANYLDAATNSDESKDWATWKGYEPYVIKDFDGYKVAIIGFGNPNIPKWDVPANWEGIYFANIIETYQHYEAEMLEQADMIVVVAHSGIGSDEGSDFIERLVNATNTISFAFSGHEHGNQVYQAKNADGKDVPILQPYTKARAIAQVKVTVENGDVSIAPEIKNMEGYTLDEELAALLQPYETDTWENYMLQPIGKALGDYPAANLGSAPSAFMDLINTVQTWGAYDRDGVNTPNNPDDDTPAMLSISAPLTSGNNENLISAGDIVLGDMFGLYRFENWFYQITMTGEEVHQWLEFAATKIRVDDSGNPYVTSGDLTYYDVIFGEGFHYDINAAKPEGERVVNMTYNGQPVAADQIFTVVVNNYRYNGGGNYVKWLNEHGCEFVANDPERIIYSTQFDMIQGEDEGQARALLVSYIKDQTAKNGGITPFISSDWTVTYDPGKAMLPKAA